MTAPDFTYCPVVPPENTLGRSCTNLCLQEWLQFDKNISMNLVEAVGNTHFFSKMKQEMGQLQTACSSMLKALDATNCLESGVEPTLYRLQPHRGAPGVSTTREFERSGKEKDTGLPVPVHRNHGLKGANRSRFSADDSPDRNNVDLIQVPWSPAKGQQQRTLTATLQACDEVEQCAMYWQRSFQDLNEQHEIQLQACQADLTLLLDRIDNLTRFEIARDSESNTIQRARAELCNLVHTVDAFPRKAQVEFLVRELNSLKQSEAAAQNTANEALQALEEARNREQAILFQMETNRFEGATQQQDGHGTIRGALAKWQRGVSRHARKLWRAVRESRIPRLSNSPRDTFTLDAQLTVSSMGTISDGMSSSVAWEHTGRPHHRSKSPSIRVLQRIGSDDDELHVFLPSDCESSTLSDSETLSLDDFSWLLQDAGVSKRRRNAKKICRKAQPNNPSTARTFNKNIGQECKKIHPARVPTN